MYINASSFVATDKSISPWLMSLIDLQPADTPKPQDHAHVAYFGDHIVSDVIAARRHTHWHVVSVVEELLLLATSPLSDDDAMTAAFLRQSLPVWGSFMDNEDKLDGSHVHLWEQLVRQYSHISVPHIDAVAQIDGLFTTFSAGKCKFGIHNV